MILDDDDAPAPAPTSAPGLDPDDQVGGGSSDSLEDEANAVEMDPMSGPRPLPDAKDNRKCKTQDPKTAGVLLRILCSEFPQEWNRCALVGGALELNGTGLGPEIDAHDTVIRVNRVPSVKFFDDFGNRTDVLFAGPRAEGRAMFNMLGQYVKIMGGGYTLCEFSSVDCPFKALILKGVDWPLYRKRWDAMYPLESPGWRPKRTKWPLGHQMDEVNALAYDLLGGSRPTNGFHAFLTSILLCNSLDVYGFSGVGTADGHRMATQHNLDREHDLLRQLGKGRLTYRSSNIRGTGKPLNRHLVDRIRSRKGQVHIYR